MKTTYEICGECMGEVDIPVDKISKCPECGESIRPCSDCLNDYNRCDWNESGYCWRFPKVGKKD